MLVKRTALLAILLLAPLARADDLQQRATWSHPAAVEVQQLVSHWLSQQEDIGALQTAKIEALWATPPAASEMLKTVVTTIQVVKPEYEELKQSTNEPRELLKWCERLSGDEPSPLVRSNMRLQAGVLLTRARFYNEGLELLSDLEVEHVVDPASLLFYRGVCQYRLLDRQGCLSTVNRLLQTESGLPQRYLRLSQLMVADLQMLQSESLDEVSRLMDSIAIRLGHGRAGTRVRGEQDQVVAILDKLIARLDRPPHT